MFITHAHANSHISRKKMSTLPSNVAINISILDLHCLLVYSKLMLTISVYFSYLYFINMIYYPF